MIQFTVTGEPEPQGSSKAFIVHAHTKDQRAIVTSDNPDPKAWRDIVSAAANYAMRVNHEQITEGAVEVDTTFYFERPKSVSKKIFHKITRPDADKLLRAILDALTQVVYFDDSQVVGGRFYKRFGSPARAEISVRLAPVEDHLPLFKELETVSYGQ